MTRTTTWRGAAIAVTTLVALMAGCSAADTSGSGAAVSESADVTTPSDDDPTVGDVAVEAISDATRALCGAERRTLEVASEAYAVMTGSLPTSVDDMVGDFLREAPAEFDIGPDGSVRAIPGGRCA
jgi:hypothetical protein